ncbi:MAG: protein-disulfide reductase DsbD [Gammaproteobacteria bacterium]
MRRWLLVMLGPLAACSAFAGEPAGSGWFAGFGDPSQSAARPREFLHPDQAFTLSVEAQDPQTLLARFAIEDGYYLYKDKFGFESQDARVALANVELPAGKFKEDPEFGRVEVYTDDTAVRIPLLPGPGVGRPGEGRSFDLGVAYQGCAEDGICYPPITKTVAVTLPPRENINKWAQGTATALSPEDSLAQRLAGGETVWTLLCFVGFGLLLSFTPCVFPMIPILSGIVVGQGKGITTGRAFSLSLVFVLMMAATYAGMGVIAGLFGHNLQATFQNPWVLSIFAGVFIVLGLSMFGVLNLQVPAAWQGRIAQLSGRQRGGTWGGVAAMGFFSALIVGPCVAPPLAGALIYIGSSGDALLGGMALFALGLGMGIPLLCVGVSAGRLLPRAGAWMEKVKAVFGVLMLGVAIWLLERLLPAPVTVLLWGLLISGSAIYLGALDHFDTAHPRAMHLSRGLGLALLVYGSVLVVGAAGGATDAWNPLAQRTAERSPSLAFDAIKGQAGLEEALDRARSQGRPVLLDLYADWCVECKELERDTFTDDGVQDRLSRLVRLRADVTANDDIDQRLLKGLGVFGPPALIFYGPDGVERRPERVVGFIGPRPFREHLDGVLSP